MKLYIDFYLENYAEDLSYSSFINWLFTFEYTVDSMQIDSDLPISVLSKIKTIYDTWYNILNDDLTPAYQIVIFTDLLVKSPGWAKEYLYSTVGINSRYIEMILKIPNKLLPGVFIKELKCTLVHRRLKSELIKNLKQHLGK